MSTLRQGLVARTEQRLALLPRMLQSIEILQLATVELLELIDRELEQNEALDMVQSAEPYGDWEPRSRPRDGDEDPKLARLHQEPARRKDLWTHVRDEVAMLDLTEDVVARVLGIVERLDADGFLSDPDEVAERLGEEAFQEALDVLRHIEPPGLGARGPIEAMLLQVDPSDPDRPAIEAVLERHLDELARNRLPDVARALGVDVGEIEDLLEKIGGLEPRPASRFTDTTAPAIRPDLVVRRVHGRLEVVVDDLALPVLAVNEDYARMAGDAAVPRDVRRYLGGKLRSARDLIEAVESRKRTLCRVGAAILTEQPGFLERGRRAIRPLRMADVAETLELHASTVSRAIAGKYLGCQHGVIALRDFFDGGVSGSGSGESLGRAAVVERIREIVAAEDPCAPLSDGEIARRLGDLGISVARRTVAKHRAALGIPPASRRRRYRRGDPD